MLIFSHFNWQWPVYQFWSDVLHFRNSSFCPQKISFCLNQLQFTHLFFSQFRLVSAEDSPAQNAASLKDTPDTHPVPSKNATSMLRDRGLCYPWAFGSHGSLSRCPCHCHGGDSYPHQGAPDSEVCHSPDLQDSQVGSGPQSSQILKPTFAESWKTKPTKPKQENHVVASRKLHMSNADRLTQRRFSQEHLAWRRSQGEMYEMDRVESQFSRNHFKSWFKLFKLRKLHLNL